MTINWNEVKVLLLEDEPIVALSTETDLEDIGLSDIKVCYRLEKAKEAVEADHFDAAILDINVQGPQTSIKLGMQLAKQGTAVIFASGNNFADTGLEPGDFQFVEKPYSFASLKDALLVALGTNNELG